MQNGKELILVDLDDRETGTGEKLEVHRRGLLHRAFSVFLFDGERLLVQRRADGKYHSAGLWANTCCSHPRKGEPLAEAVSRRLEEECGIAGAEVQEAGSFVYRAVFPNGLTEYELDHVFAGEYAGLSIRIRRKSRSSGTRNSRGSKRIWPPIRNGMPSGSLRRWASRKPLSARGGRERPENGNPQPVRRCRWAFFTYGAR